MGLDLKFLPALSVSRFLPMPLGAISHKCSSSFSREQGGIRSARRFLISHIGSLYPPPGSLRSKGSTGAAKNVLSSGTPPPLFRSFSYAWLPTQCPESKGKMRVLGLALCSLAVVVGWVAFSWRDTFDPESLSGARVLITGASTGIGEQMAYHYARFGAEVVLTARRESVLEKVAEKCLDLGAKKAFVFPADMASPIAPEKLVRFALEKLGGLDYVVLNHIGWTPFAMWSGDVAHVRWLTEVNFLSYVAITSAALPALIESKGCIIVLSSLTGRIATPFTASYSATKFALEGFFGSLRNELAMQRKDVCVTVCVLGLIDSESALNKTRGMVDLKASPVSETALAIVKAGATRTMELFYPWTVQLVCLIRDWFPEQRNGIMQGFYNYHPPDA